MEVKNIGIWHRIRMRGLKNKGMIEISEDPKTAEYVAIMANGVHRKWLVFNFPEGMWKARGSKEEVSEAVRDFLTKTVLAG